MRLSDKNNTAPIPYRDSKLTRVLRQSLDGNAKVTVICNISPSSFNIEESVSTLKFAQRAKKVKQIAVKNETAGSKMLILKYENEIANLQIKLQDMELKISNGLDNDDLKQEIGVMKERLSQEIVEKAKLNEAFEQAMIERTQLEAEISRLKSYFLVSENIQMKSLEPELGDQIPLDRRIRRYTVSRDPTEEKPEPNERCRTESIMAFNQEDFFKKTISCPEQVQNLHKTLAELESPTIDFSNSYSVRDTMLLDKIDNVNALFDGFNPRMSMMTNISAVRDSFAFFNTPDTPDDKNLPSKEQLISVIAEQEKIITLMQKDNLEKSDQIEMLKDELELCRNNLKGIQKQLRDMKKAYGK